MAEVIAELDIMVEDDMAEDEAIEDDDMAADELALVVDAAEEAALEPPVEEAAPEESDWPTQDVDEPWAMVTCCE